MRVAAAVFVVGLTSLLASAEERIGVVSAKSRGKDVLTLLLPKNRLGQKLDAIDIELESGDLFGVAVTLCNAADQTDWQLTTDDAKADWLDSRDGGVVSFWSLDGFRSGNWIHLRETIEPVCVQQVQLGEPGRPLVPVLPRHVSAKITATSVLEPAHAYGPERAFDDDLTSAWSTKGDGTGQTLTVVFAQPQKLTGLRLAAGYWRSTKLARENAQPSRLAISADGVALEAIDLQDTSRSASPNSTPYLQRVDFNRLGLKAEPAAASRWDFTIKEIRPGTRFKDTLISEIELFNGLERVVPDGSRN